MTKVATVLTSVPVWQTKGFVSAVKVLFSVWKALTVKVGIKIRRQGVLLLGTATAKRTYT